MRCCVFGFWFCEANRVFAFSWVVSDSCRFRVVSANSTNFQVLERQGVLHHPSVVALGLFDLLEQGNFNSSPSQHGDFWHIPLHNPDKNIQSRHRSVFRGYGSSINSDENHIKSSNSHLYKNHFLCTSITHPGLELLPTQTGSTWSVHVFYEWSFIGSKGLER